ncbi:MAG TPA: ROK family protein [Marmoricola sp.]|nr:ROK family protein [Marmoricola sp.]
MTVETRGSSRESPGSATSLRVANLQRVLAVLLDARGAAVTQAELTRTTGLAAGTVSSIVRELAAAAVVDTVAGSGRRGTTVRLARGAGLVAGVDFGHSHVMVAVGDMAGQILAEARRPIDPGHDHNEGLDRAGEMLDGLLEGLDAQHHELRNIGLGLPAPISDEVVMSSAILPGWVGVNARRAAARRFGRAVQIDNDANLGALAEHRHGAGRGHADMVFVKVSSGVGAGLIIGNTLYRGSTGTSGEIGHLTLDDQGPLCRCGSRGCLEAYAASGTALSMMSEQMPDATIDDLVRSAHEGNVAALRVFEDAGLHLGWGLAALTNLMNPGIIVVGGDMARAGDLLLDSARIGLRRHVLAGAATTPVVAAALGDRASVIGAMLLAIEATDLVPDG